METRDKVFKENLADWLLAKGNRKKRAEIASHMVFFTKCHPKIVNLYRYLCTKKKEFVLSKQILRSGTAKK